MRSTGNRRQLPSGVTQDAPNSQHQVVTKMWPPRILRAQGFYCGWSHGPQSQTPRREEPVLYCFTNSFGTGSHSYPSPSVRQWGPSRALHAGTPAKGRRCMQGSLSRDSHQAWKGNSLHNPGDRLRLVLCVVCKSFLSYRIKPETNKQ